MDQPPYSPRQLGWYVALAHVGVEMVAPLVLGVWLDLTYDWLPWATLIGFGLGFVGGFVHLLVLLNKSEEIYRNRPGGDNK